MVERTFREQLRVQRQSAQNCATNLIYLILLHENLGLTRKLKKGEGTDEDHDK